MTSETIYDSIYEIQKDASIKYARLYISLCDRAVKRAADRKSAQEITGKYIEGHHILPKCIRPDLVRDKNNIVFLTAREHFIAHKILIRITTGQLKRKMQTAVGKFLQATVFQSRIFNQKDYAYMRAQLSASMKGTMLITNGVNNARIDKSNVIPVGWWIGSCIKSKESKLKGKKVGYYSEDRVQKQKSKLQDFMFITNGVISKKIKVWDPIPAGYYRGRQNGTLSIEIKNIFRKQSIEAFGYASEEEFKRDLTRDIELMQKTELQTKYSHIDKKNHNLPNVFSFIREYGFVAKRGKPGPKSKNS